MYKLLFHPLVTKDLDELSDEIAKEVFLYFVKYKSDPYKYSLPLYNQGNIKLQGYRKTYVADASHRIIIKIENNIAKVVKVVAIGSRKNKEVYHKAFFKKK